MAKIGRSVALQSTRSHPYSGGIATARLLREYLNSVNSWFVRNLRLMRHVISILLQNESGALARVASMFASRGFNIESLNVAPTEDESVSRLTLVTIGTDEVISQMNKQLAKLIDVVAVADRTSTDHIERELGLLKLSVESDAATLFDELVAAHGAQVLERDLDHVTVEVTGNERDVDRFLKELPPGATVLSLVRSGPLVTVRGAGSLA